MLLKVNKNPSPKELRQFGWTLIIGFALIGAALYWRGKIPIAYGAWGAGISLGLLSLTVPSAAKWIYRGWMGWAFIMGTIVTRIILTVLFFVVITPVAVLFRCLGRDALALKKNAASDSYWKDYPKIADRSYYKRLF